MVQGDPAFEPVFQRLRGFLEPYARRMHISADAEGVYGVDMAPKRRSIDPRDDHGND
jgi:hypothetical protein